MSLLFFLHSLNQPSRLATPRFTRRARMQMLVHFFLDFALEPVKQKIRRHMFVRRVGMSRSTGRHLDSCHFQLRAF